MTLAPERARRTAEGTANRTIVEVLRSRAEPRSDAADIADTPAYTFLESGETEAASLTWRELDRRARALAAFLQDAGLAGERALLLFPPGLDFVAAFLGCLYAGTVAVPAYPPRPESRSGKDERLRAIAADCEPRAVLTTAAVRRRSAPELPGALWLAVDDPVEVPDGAAESWRELAPDPERLAFLQYTSGSTSTPKGVRVTHANLIHNQRMIQRAFRQSEDSVVVGWLPLYHDMGLIGNVLQPLWVGGRCVLMSPAAFLQRPGRWLRAISRYRATTSGGPDFAYDLCVRRIGPAEREGLDLSSWDVAFDGAEPVRAATLERFAATFAPYGFRRESFQPCYGLAEATLLVSGGKPDPGRPGVRTERGVVGCGEVAAGSEVAIASPETGWRLPPGEVGEIWVSGPSVAAGYWRRLEESRETFEAELAGEPGTLWLRTGDLGFLEGGELFVTGRIKDLLILRGRNLYPQDVERTAEASHPALRPGGGAAFSVDADAEERLVLVLETEPRARFHAADAVDIEDVAAAVRRAVAEEHEAAVLEVVLIPAGALPRTSSGKVRRGACREAFLAGALPAIGRSRMEPERLADHLARSVARLLGTDPGQIDRDLPLAALGLDSLASIELRSRLEAELGVEVPLAGLLEDGGVGALAEKLAEGVEARSLPEPGAGAPSPAQRGRVGEGDHPPSEGQRSLWFLHQLAPETSAQNLAAAGWVLSEIDVTAFERALEDLARRHETLRTTFPVVDGEPVQRVHPEGRIDFGVVSDSSESWLLTESRRPFDLESGPLVRVRLGVSPGQPPLLLLVAHHLVLDFGSLGVLLDDLRVLYEARRTGQPAALPPPALQPADFALWQAGRLAGPRGDLLRSFWRERLAEMPAAVTPPADGPRRAVPVHPAATVPLRFGPAWTGRLRASASRAGHTLYAELLAGLFGLLGRLSGETDLRVGSPAAGRTAAGFEATAGYLMNPLTLRVDASGDPAFGELAGQAWRTVIAALEHQEYPSHLLARDIRDDKDGRDELFRVLFTFNGGRRAGASEASALAAGDEGARVSLGGLVLRPVPVPAGETLFDLHLLLGESDGRLAGSLTAAADLYDRPTVARFAAQLETLLAAAGDDPSRRLWDLPLLGEAERWQLVGEWNDTAADSRPLPVHLRILEQAARTPNALAVLSEWERLSYRELVERAGRLARALQDRGAGPEVRIGLCAERTPEAIVGLLGILLSGAAYVPVDPAYPPERVAYVLEDSGAAAVVSQRRLAGRLPASGPQAVWLEDLHETPSPTLPRSAGEGAPTQDSDWATVGRAEGAPALERDLGRLDALSTTAGGGALSRASARGRVGEGASPGNLAYLLYTSGSTGQPKGVLVSHGSLASYIETAARSFEIRPGDRVLQFASLGFDTSAEEIFPCLVRGATLVLRTDAMVGSVPRFLEVCARWQVTVLDLPTAFWHELVAGAGGLSAPATLRLVVLGGERAAPEAIEAWGIWAPPQVRLINSYGPTEATIVATACDLPDPGWRPGREVSIGRPVQGVRAHVLAVPAGPIVLAPPGVPGELALAGTGLARGYLGRPAATAERFVPDPFGPFPGGRLYRTGDRVRQRPDGTLEFAGRLDRQVKVRGFRVEPGEIESALEAHPDVREAAVVAVRSEGRDTRDARLAAYVVPARVLDLAAVRHFLAERLPPYMVPGSFVVLDAMPRLPRTPSGKLDRAVLPAPGTFEAGIPAEIDPPRSPVEAALVALWADCLETGPERIGIHDDFFELGGHSLLVTRVISRAREELGVEIPLATFFEAPTVADLALTVESAGRSNLPPIQRVPRDRPIPLSFAQERLWFLAQLDRASLVAYHVPRIVHVTGRFDVWALERAYEALIARHETLRTVFPTVDGQSVQKILPPYRFTLPVVDLESLPLARRRPELERIVAREVRSSFDLVHGPLLWATFVRLGDEESTLIQSEHHIVHDGWTQGVLLDDLLALYTGFHEGRPALLPALPVQYADFAVWQREWLQGKVLEEHLAYWRGKLAGMPPVLDLPADRPRPPVQTFRGSTQFFHLPPALLAGVTELARHEGATLFMVLLSAFEVLLHRYARRDDLVVATPIANRTHLEIEGLIGFFVNTLLLRTDLGGRPSFRELIERVRLTTLGAYAHQHLPFERLVEELAPERNLAYNPLCQVMFILQNARVPELRLPGLVLRHTEVHNDTAKFDLMLSLQERDGGLFGWAEYSTDLFDATTIQRLRGHFERLLATIPAAPERPLLDFPWLAPAEEQQLLVEWGLSADPFHGPEHPTMAFRHQARETPDAPALVHRAESLTYGELLRRVESLADHLWSLGVGPEVRVALGLEPGFDLMTSLLAVLEAGGAYIPLDPSHPADRLLWILEDADAPFLLTHSSLASRFPPGARLLCVDDLGRGRPLPRSGGGLGRGSTCPANLAYVLYTSGSTGRPKGVEISRASLDALLRSIRARPGLAGPVTVLSSTTVAFDIAAVELFLPLCIGGRLLFADRDVATDGRRLAALLRAERPALMQGTPSLYTSLVDAGWEGDPDLHVWCAGEALPRALADRVATTCASLWNLYGPTEATIYASGCRIHSGPGPVPIGGPAGGADLQILDPELRPVPAGVPGELFIGGPGVARGYLGRPGLTAERFVPDPSGRVPGGRLYRTGDLTRWLPDGRVEFLGRLDHQVKLRGYRIELGEVEAALRLHPSVAQAAVLLVPGPSGDPRLVAYVVPGAAGSQETEPLSEWREVWDQIYGSSGEDAAFDLAGWVSSYTGEPLGEEPMREWVERTVERILALRPERILEIGCGTGLLLYRLAPHCRLYRGTDLSPAVVERLRARLSGDPAFAHVAVEAAAADDPEVFPGEAFDLIVLNSVVQYFPSLEYLVGVLEAAAARLRPGGAIFLGDLRSLPLLETFRTGVQLHRADEAVPAEALRRRAREQVEREKELVLDPRLFPALLGELPGIGAAEVQLKRGRHRNELTRYRYDVVLRAGAPAVATTVEEAGWGEVGSLEELRRRVERALGEGRALAVRRIPNARVAEEVAALRRLGEDASATAGELRAAVAEAGWGAVDPEDLWALAAMVGGEAEVGWEGGGETGEMAAVFRKAPSPTLPHAGAWERAPSTRPADAMAPGVAAPSPAQRGRVGEGASPYANRPRTTAPSPTLVPDLTEHLRERLPAYMVPSAWVVMETLPLTPTGKVDRKALPAPRSASDTGREAGSLHVAPRTPTEEGLAGIWAEVLGLRHVGALDDFFALGGHSLLATRLTSRILRRFGVDLPLKALFESPTLAGLAGRIDREMAEAAGPARPVLPPLIPGQRPDPIPLSFAQQRLWFLDRLGSGTSYNLPAGIRMRGSLDPALLERCLNEAVRRHEILRTWFDTADGISGMPCQRIAPELWVPMVRLDLAGLPASLRPSALREAGTALLSMPFELDRLPLLRALLVRLDRDDHALVLALHHIVADGWSQGVLLRDLTTLYAAGGDCTALPPLPVQYADFAVWQRSWLAGEVLAAELAFWRERLAGAPAVLDLPADRPRPAVPSFRGGLHRFVLPGRLARSLAGMAAGGEATLFQLLLAAFQTLLGRLSGQDDLVIGSPIANRNRIETENLVGFFVNTLALRGDLSGDPPFLELLARARETTLAAYAHQDLPFERLVEDLRPERALGYSPLFQVVLAFHNTPLEGAPPSTSGLAWEPLPLETGQSAFDLTLSLVESPDRLAGSLVYRRDLFDEPTVRRLALRLEALLEGIAAAPGARLSELPVLPEAERHQVVHEWPAPRDSFAETCLHERFESWAARTPDAIALIFEDRRWTYAELDARANRLARALRRMGIGPERVVGLCLERSPELVAAILGVLKAGGAYLPLDPGQPPARRDALLAQGGARALVTTADLAASFQAAVPILLPDSEQIAAESPEPVPPLAVAENLAYVLFTSGSTGFPKGCLVTHGNVSRLLAAARASFGFGPGDVWTLFHAYHFDYSVWEMWGALAHGGRLVVVPFWVARSPADYLDLLRREEVTVLNQTPAFFRELVREPGPVTGSLRWVGLGGEALPLAALETWFERHGHAHPEVVNLYGPTEAGVLVTTRRITAADLLTPHRSPLGQGLPDVRLYTVDRQGRPAGLGVPGELAIGGPSVGRGYRGRPEATAERFVPDPFSGLPGERLYLTGDRVRLDVALGIGSELEFLGRTDQQVKIRGFRIEPGEIAATLEQHPEVAEAAVVAREGRLVAYAVRRPSAGSSDLPAELRRFLAERLPEAMVPTAFTVLAAFPRTASGKVDRRALSQIGPEPERMPSREPAPPRTPLEEILAGLFADVLELPPGAPPVGIHDSFFELGGHSLLATALVAEIRGVLDLDLPLRSLFTAPTVAGLAAAILEDPAWRAAAQRSVALLAELMDAGSGEPGHSGLD